MTGRTGGQILVDQLKIHGASRVFCVPGESYLAVLDALHGLGVKEFDMPASPHRVWEAIQAAKA